MPRPEPPEDRPRREPTERTSVARESSEPTKPLDLEPPRSMRTALIASLTIAGVALALAALPLLRPVFTSDDAASAAEVENATTKVCAAYNLALGAVKLQTNEALPTDPAGKMAVAANARLALFVASENLRAAVDDSAAAPAELQKAVRELAAQYRVVTSNYLAGKDNNAPEIAAAFDQAGDAAARINKVCQT